MQINENVQVYRTNRHIFHHPFNGQKSSFALCTTGQHPTHPSLRKYQESLFTRALNNINNQRKITKHPVAASGFAP